MMKKSAKNGEGVKFERIRRITGYLVGTVDRFNNIVFGVVIMLVRQQPAAAGRRSENRCRENTGSSDAFYLSFFHQYQFSSIPE